MEKEFVFKKGSVVVETNKGKGTWLCLQWSVCV